MRQNNIRGKFLLPAIVILSLCTAFKVKADSIPDINKDEKLLGLNVEARLDYQYVSEQKKMDRSQTGFMGKYIAFKAQGTLTKGLSYTWRQRFSRTPKDNSFWDQTDILDLTYHTGKFDIGAGKQVVMIGGYEYNRAPIDLMCPNLFVTNVACYQFGVSAGYQVSKNDYIALQVSQSLFATSEDRNLYAYNLQWSSARDLTYWLRFETIWSVNEIEYQRGKYCNYLALGNKFVVNNKLSVLVDLMTRTYPDNNFLKNNTFNGEVSYDITPNWRVTAKASYDCNRGVNTTEMSEIARGSQLAIGGTVVEWFPIRNNRHLLRMHAAAFYSKGDNRNEADMMQKNTFYASVGLTWHMNLLNIRR